MFKHIVFLICLSLASNIFAMVYEEDENNHWYLAGTLTCPGERYPMIKMKRMPRQPTKKVESSSVKPQKNDRNCLSIIKSLLEQFEHASPIGFVNIQ